MSGSNEFSRAPGTTTKPQGGSTSPNINPLLGQADGYVYFISFISA